jgi:hypothetical protein
MKCAVVGLSGDGGFVLANDYWMKAEPESNGTLQAGDSKTILGKGCQTDGFKDEQQIVVTRIGGDIPPKVVVADPALFLP